MTSIRVEYIPGIIQRVDEEQRGGTGHTAGGQVTGHPLGIPIAVLVELEHRLVGVAESKVEGLGREVSDDVGSVASPQRHDTLLLGGTAEALDDTVVFTVKTTTLQHFILKSNLSVTWPSLEHMLSEVC